MNGPPGAPVVLIEVGVHGLDDPVVTKDESVTTVSLNWRTDMPAEVVAEARRVLEPLRHDHPRFAAVLIELREVYG